MADDAAIHHLLKIYTPPALVRMALASKSNWRSKEEMGWFSPEQMAIHLLEVMAMDEEKARKLREAEGGEDEKDEDADAEEEGQVEQVSD